MGAFRRRSVPEASQLRDGLGEIEIRYHVVLTVSQDGERRFTLTNHHLNAGSVYLVNVEVPQDPGLHILDQKRNQQQSLYELDYKQTGIADGAPPYPSGPSGWLNRQQFSSLFHLGMQHIAEGTDHLLFLLVLLLPAPLLVVRSRWQGTAGVRGSLFRVAGIVTAFTIGHSLTLTLAAMKVVRVPSRPVEAMIALPILVSAIHALRPFFPGREAWIAAFFGLIHGLAFASTLDRLGLSRWDRIGGILAFNLGIEAMQLMVVALILPSLLLLSRTRAYTWLRVSGVISASVASSAWIAERVFGIQTGVDSWQLMPKRPCAGGCGAPVQRGYCDRCVGRSPAKLAEQRHAQQRDPRVKGWYDSERWRVTRIGYFREHPLCEGLRLKPDGPIVINTHPGRIVAADELDHIIPHDGDYDRFWDRGNWQGGCKTCHSTKTAREDGGFGHRRSSVEGGGVGQIPTTEPRQTAW